MPYESIAKAKTANFPTKLEDIPLSLAQINKLAELYDAIKESGSAENPMAVAWTSWKGIYKKSGDKWVLKKKVESKVVSGGIDFGPQSEDEWVAVAKVGQEALLSPGNKIVRYGEEGLKNYADALKSLDITYNHDSERKIDNEQITNAKFEDKFLYMQMSEQLREAIKNEKVSGLSIEGIPKKIKDGILLDVEGTALTLMEYPQLPACKIGDGCGVVSGSTFEQADVTTTAGADTQTNVSSQEAVAIKEEESKVFDVCTVNNEGSIVKIGHDAVYGSKKQLKDKEYIKVELIGRGGYHGRASLQYYNANEEIKIGDVLPNGTSPVHVMSIVISKQEPELAESDNRHLEMEAENIEQLSRGGDNKGMEKEEPITYTGEQVKEMVTSAVGEAETNLKNQQEVDITALKDTEKKAKEELSANHEKELKESSEQAYRKAEAITTFKAKFNPSEEALKQAEGLDPGAIEFFVGLDIPSVEVASGVTSGAPKDDEKAEGTLKDVKARFNQKLGRGVKEG